MNKIAGVGSFIQSLVKRLNPNQIDKAANIILDAAAQAHQESPLPLREIAAKFAQATGKSESAQSSEKISQKDIQTALKNPDSVSAYELAKNPNLPITPDLIDFAKQNPETAFAGGLAQNQNLKITPDLIDFAKQNPETAFAGGLTQNQNLKITPDLIDFAKQNPETAFAVGLDRNPNFKA
jgi:hypothetical protein